MCRELHLGSVSTTKIELWTGRDMTIFRSGGGTKYTAPDGLSLSLIDDGKFAIQ